MTPTYVAKRVGDEYVLVRVDAEGIIRRAGLAGLGLGLVGFGMAKRGLVGVLACVGGSMLAYNAWTGRGVGSTRTRSAGSAGTRGGLAGKQQSTERDVDEASMESFPASDPPALRGERR